jgi:hypothetical protein
LPARSDVGFYKRRQADRAAYSIPLLLESYATLEKSGDHVSCHDDIVARDRLELHAKAHKGGSF